MGKCPNHKNSHGKHYSHKSARRTKFEKKGDDMIHTELRKVETPKSKELDPDLPGMGQFYCLHCDRHFTNTTIRDEHYKTKKHRRRVKLMEGPAPHNQIDAEVAAGMGTPDNGPKLRVGEDFALDM
ncbi:zinc finger C2H2 protein ECU02_0310 [Physcomitrium patens]|uniref:C2H2-type domain-containing protein n=1 Tax=Physcomitrium patens TaxID=3218 RepID=A0A2K1JMV6_PHYPA|nr:zinc finger protein 593 homolog [Physcomitrium patens]PNR42872.1 hypothetical protein PHYPA_017704 [Physcomitrium patens]|eukprot:XP_024391975.1 zinc finger protein 593 homolog [Physcomitrella patens]